MKSVFPLLLLCSLAHGAVCPTGQLKDQAALVQIEHVWLRAVEQHDMAVLGCILADEFEEADTVDAISAELRLLPNLEEVTHGTSVLLPNATKVKSGVSASS